ncbi:MAG: hypothetical protein HKN39_05510 [Flavobacteriales bacterium]|nr:hypothetical protein [Flavobacteriales bacterium]
MQILELQLFSTDLDAQETVYGDRLGFMIERSKDQLKVFCGENILIFKEGPQQFYYHYCFLIPTGSLESAIEFLNDKRFEAVPYNEERIIHFDNGKSVYFYDGNGNIAEFIERPLTNYPQKNSFEISDVIKLNEIGIPVSNPLDTSEHLMSKYGIVPLTHVAFRDDFCWVGDHHGVFLICKIGRNWMPTQKPAESNDLSVLFSEGNEKKGLMCKAGELIRTI